ncbi:MAG TPA: hypothetical protein VEI97_03370 [bacterium]|nr:hypothetical protein [bacterium]
MADPTPSLEAKAEEHAQAAEGGRGLTREYGEYEVDADVGNVPPALIWIFVFVLLWGIFSWVPFFGGVEGSLW